jgi:ribosomal protein L37AE/L43A
MGTTPTLVHERAAPSVIDEVKAPRMVSLDRCENCGSPSVFSTRVTSTVIYWRCQGCGELSVTNTDSLMPALL